jgi:uncharacterized SAM-binding protein YcdF (DUF218 family)
MRGKRYTIVILGGSMKKKNKKPWRTEDFSYLRVLAGYQLYNKLSKNNKIGLMVSGGRGIYKSIPGTPTVSSVMRKELVAMGLTEKEVKMGNKAGTTYQELLWIKNNYKKGWGKVYIISNAIHLPRVRTMIDYLSELKKLKKIVEFIPAESILVKNNRGWKNKIAKFNKSKKHRKMIVSEKKGIKALKSGNYKFR